MYCTKCGNQLNAGEKLCRSCDIDTQPQPQFIPNVQPAYYPVYIGRLKVPGKGMGIASMILGIFSIIYSSMLSLIALLSALMSFAPESSGSIDIYENMKITMTNLLDSDDIENMIAIAFTCLLCTVLAFIFVMISRSKGYRNKISTSGLILSIVSFALVFAFAAFTGYAYSTSPSKENNADTVKQQIVGEWDCGDKGYLVIGEDDTFLFNMTFSDEDNAVLYGTYEATNGIKTSTRGTIEGITLIVTVEKLTVDGVEQKISEDHKWDYAFTPDGEGNYFGEELSGNMNFKMTKIK